MKSSEGLHLKTYFLLFLMVTFGPVGDILLGKGMKIVGVPPAWTPAEFFHFFLRAFSSSMVWLGIASVGAVIGASVLVVIITALVMGNGKNQRTPIKISIVN